MADTGYVCDACHKEYESEKSQEQFDAEARALWGDDWDAYPDKRCIVCLDCHTKLLRGDVLVEGWRPSPRG